MKKFLHSRDGASKGASLTIVLVLVVFATALSPANLSAKQSPTPTPGPTATSTPTSTPAPTVTPTPGCLVIVSAAIATSGSFYAVDDYLDPLYGTLCAAADNYGFRLRVASVDSSGHVTGVTIIPGIGYSVAPSNPVRFGGSATGTGFTANCTFQ